MARMMKPIYENQEILVYDKPSGLAVQPGAGISTSVIEILKAELPEEPFLVHRLDRDTSGVLVVAKNRVAAGKFSRLMMGDGIRKEYVALCPGRFLRPVGIIRDDILQHGETKKAETRYKVEAEYTDGTRIFSMVSLELGTGRMHQIRLHLAGIGHPVLGDDKHGDFKLNRELKKALGLKKLMLHARRLTIPTNNVVEAPLPEHFQTLLAKLQPISR